MDYALTPDPNAVVVDTDGECSRKGTDTPCKGPTRERVSRSGLTVSTIFNRYEKRITG